MCGKRNIPKPTTDNKNKKTWGQRLKLSKATPDAEKQNGAPVTGADSAGATTLIPFGARGGYDPALDFAGNGPTSLASATAASGAATQLATMKYADTWVYGTVRGMPPPLAMSHHPHHHHHHPHLQAMYCPPPPPPEVAVLICCCPEYLTGTKREIKKASVCKKCKGSRLPLAPIGGTVRLTSGASYLAPAPIRTSAGTVKLAATYGKKSRPSILGNGNPDPYDFMRRSRLTQPVESGAGGGGSKSVKSSLKEKLRGGRAKSTSPSRGRSGSTSGGGKRGSAARSPSPSLSKGGSRVGGRKVDSFQDCWVGEPERDAELLEELAPASSTAPNRKSILRCDVNPYDLISLSGLGGGGGSGAGMLNEFAPDAGDEFDLHSQKYENILDTLYANRYNPPASSIAAINGQRIKLFDDTVSGAPVYDDVDEFVYDPVEVQLAEVSAAGDSTPPASGTPERPPRTKKQEPTKEDDSRSLPSSPISADPAVAAHSAIKSILKRPSSMPAGTASLPGEKDATGQPGYDTIRLNHTLVQRLAKLTTNGGTAEEASNSFGKSGTISARHLTDKRNSGSQFYLPTPFPVVAISTGSPDSLASPAGMGDGPQSTTSASGRKKVHFLVENEVIHDDDRLFAQMLFTGVTPALETPMDASGGGGSAEAQHNGSDGRNTTKQQEPTSNGPTPAVLDEQPAKVILLPAPTKSANGTNEVSKSKHS
uniref:Uncharacterized protein n=1 Tax=Anopheles dirus TaxID=7168 RepID=A0A182NIY0_9DIPT